MMTTVRVLTPFIKNINGNINSHANHRRSDDFTKFLKLLHFASKLKELLPVGRSQFGYRRQSHTILATAKTKE